jgi:mannose/fructose/N-acetylgalactosamine-specific phosphotransferase system component IIC
MKNPRIFAAILFVVGFAMLIANAAVYLGGFFGLSWEYHLPSSAIGIVFVVLGMYQLQLLKAAKQKPGKTKKT